MDANLDPSPVVGLDAVILIAADFPAQCAFYRDVLGLEVKATYADAAFFKLGGQTLGIFARSHHPEGSRRLQGASHGLSHLEFRVPRAAAAALADRLRSAGAHAYGDSFADADGNLFHFNLA
jgi:catechol 2,3-dioxygenase-like lactoylglutathione lyase family enzyme